MQWERWLRHRLDRRMKRIEAMQQLAAVTGRPRPEVEDACRGEPTEDILAAVKLASEGHQLSR